MKIERLEFVCTNAMKEQKVVTIDLVKQKVTCGVDEETFSINLQALLDVYISLLDYTILQNNADRRQYNQILESLAKTIVCYVLQEAFCDWMVIDKVTPKVVMNIEEID